MRHHSGKIPLYSRLPGNRCRCLSLSPLTMIISIPKAFSASMVFREVGFMTSAIPTIRLIFHQRLRRLEFAPALKMFLPPFQTMKEKQHVLSSVVNFRRRWFFPGLCRLHQARYEPGILQHQLWLCSFFRILNYCLRNRVF